MIKYLKFLIAFVGFVGLVQCAGKQVTALNLRGFLNYKTNSEPSESKIVGGTKAIMTPYQISLQLFEPTKGFLFFIAAKNWSHICGGAIVNEYYIVTAAHCVQDMKPEKLSVLAGITNLKEENKVPRHLVEHCLVHPDYVKLNNSDIAVCRMQTAFKFGNTIAPINLDKTEFGGGENCKLSGWGYTFSIRGTPSPDDLQEGNFTTITNEECIKNGIAVGPKELCTAAAFMKGACGVRKICN